MPGEVQTPFSTEQILRAKSWGHDDSRSANRKFVNQFETCLTAIAFKIKEFIYQAGWEPVLILKAP